MEREPETFKPPKRYSVPNPPHGVKVKVEVMQRVKGRRRNLAGEEKMAEIGAGKCATGVARTVLIDRPLVVAIAGILDVDAAAGREQLAVPRIAGGQDAVEHVDAASH